MSYKSLLTEIQKGREGRSHGISIGLPKLEELIDGVTQGTYTLIFAGSGVGKSSILIYAYLYRVIMEHLEDGKVRINFFSLEMKSEIILAKLLSLYIYEKFGKRLGFKELLSRKKDYILSDEDYDIVMQCQPWLEKVDKILNIIDKNVSADGAYAIIMEDLKNEGTWEGSGRTRKFVPNDPDKTLLTMMDHLALLKFTKSKKDEIDKFSHYAVSIRNRTNMSFVFLMQSNRDSASMDRKKQGYQEPMPSDLKESGTPYEDSDVVLSIYDPITDHLANYHDYNIKALNGKFKAIICLKNRYGASNKADYCYFDGKISYWKELPPANEIIDYTNIFNTIDKVKTIDKANSNFNFTM